MTARIGRPKLINIEDSNIHRKINFNYSENFNKKIELNTQNYVGWCNNIRFLLNHKWFSKLYNTSKSKKTA